MQKLLTVLVCLFAAVSVSMAAGTTSGEFLKIGAGARAAGMGDVFAGVSDDSSAIYWNPSGLNQIENMCGSLMHSMWIEGISYNWISFVYPMSGKGVIGGGLTSVSYGSLIETDETGLEIGTFSPADIAVTVSYAWVISDIPVGASLKIISSQIKESSQGFGLDIGGMYEMEDYGLTLGGAIQNLGGSMKYVSETDPLPMNIKLGASYIIEENWIAAGDLNVPSGSDFSLGFGTEYRYKLNTGMIICGRAGYNMKTKDISGMQGMSLGFGLDQKGYSFDYSYSPYGDLGAVQKISLSAKFGGETSMFIR